MIKQYFKKLSRFVPAYSLSAVDRREADSAAVVSAVKVLAAIQVKTTYGLTFNGVSHMFKEQAVLLSAAAAGDSVGRKDRAQLLHMSGVLDALSDELKFEGAKGESKNK